MDLHFDQSAATLPIEGLVINGKKVSHAEYFKTRKNIVLQYPNARPMIECLGRRKQTIFLPAELVCGDELDRRVKEMLPSIASYTPEKRNESIEEIKGYLIPGKQVRLLQLDFCVSASITAYYSRRCRLSVPVKKLCVTDPVLLDSCSFFLVRKQREQVGSFLRAVLSYRKTVFRWDSFLS